MGPTVSVGVETSPLPATHPEVLTPIRPSEAIRLGTLATPTAIRGRLFDGDGGSCALGAMAIGLGLVESEVAGVEALGDSVVVESLERALPPVLPHPERYAIGPTVQVIASLNDGFGWSRKRIAAWLAGWGW